MTVSHSEPVIMPAAAIAQRKFEPLGPTVPVTHTVLWRDDTTMAGVLVLSAGQRLGEHTHRLHHHHLWVVDGEAVILGERLGAGSYVHVPNGVVHDVDASGTDGCRVFYLYLGSARPEP
jgi:quercetin dioxygenase-like cupin family protein